MDGRDISIGKMLGTGVMNDFDDYLQKLLDESGAIVVIRSGSEFYPHLGRNDLISVYEALPPEASTSRPTPSTSGSPTPTETPSQCDSCGESSKKLTRQAQVSTGLRDFFISITDAYLKMVSELGGSEDE